MRVASGVLGAVALLLAVPAVSRGQAIPIGEQNALVKRHCAVCHTDAARNGGLSLQHFDAADAPASLVAMMVSKLTQGVPLGTVQAATVDSKAAALVSERVVGGAMFAAGIKVPIPTIAAFTTALAARAVEPTRWHLSRTPDPATRATVTMVSALRELPVMRDGAVTPSYRLVLACNDATGEGEMQLAWSPVPKNGTLMAAFDGQPASVHKVEGTPAAFALVQTKPADVTAAALPERLLTVSGLFPNETVEFSFDDMPAAMRQPLHRCFAGSQAGL